MTESFEPSPPVAINHPLADSISIQDHAFAYAGRGSVELAFFANGKWVDTIIPEFAEYADGEAGGTRVYCYVPIATVDDFLETYRA